MINSRFLDRRDAGERLAELLAAYAHRPDVLVVGLPRGGVPVAAEVAAELGAPLDVLVVRKLGVPWHPEFAMGAVASGGITVLNHEAIEQLGITRAAVEQVTALELAELARREHAYRGDAAPLDVTGLDVILVDDGLATGATMSAAVQSLRARRARRIVVAVPVASQDALRMIRRIADDCVCVLAPERFDSVGRWYRDFGQTTDAEVHACLRAPAARRDAAGAG